MSFRLLITAVLISALSAPALGQSGDNGLSVGSDLYLSGRTVVFEEPGKDDLYMFGRSLTAQADLNGSAYIAGRKIEVSGNVGGDALLAGMDVTVSGRIAGDASVAGNNIAIGEVQGDLRAAGGTLSLDGPVAGYALLAGDEIRLGDVITGDVHLTGRIVTFGEGARVEGQLVVYEETIGTLEVPENVAPEMRIQRRSVDEWDRGPASMSPRSWASLRNTFLTGVLTVAVLAILAAAFIPKTLADLRRSLLEHPLRSLWIGFLAQSVVVGSAILFAMTVVGILLIPASLIVALVVGFAGYVVAAYAFGVGVLAAVGRSHPTTLRGRAIAAGTGALLVGLIGLIPFLGWLFVLALVLAGVGAIALRLFQPAFFVAPEAG